MGLFLALASACPSFISDSINLTYAFVSAFISTHERPWNIRCRRMVVSWYSDEWCAGTFMLPSFVSKRSLSCRRTAKDCLNALRLLLLLRLMPPLRDCHHTVETSDIRPSDCSGVRFFWEFRRARFQINKSLVSGIPKEWWDSKLAKHKGNLSYHVALLERCRSDMVPHKFMTDDIISSRGWPSSSFI